MRYIVSIATIPQRIDYFKKSFQSILNQTAIDRIDEIVINLDDTISDEDYIKYDFLRDNPKITIAKRPAKWRCANKLIWTYMEHRDDAIIAFDDDKNYPVDCIDELISVSERCPGVIVAEESNGISLTDDDVISFKNNIELAYGHFTFTKYLSNACLFPPNCFGDGSLLIDYEKYFKLTEGTQDELWFWVVSTLNGVYTTRLNTTYSYAMDKDVTFPLHETALTHKNAKQESIDGYNKRLMEMFGKELIDIINGKEIIFTVSLRNYEAVLMGLPYIHAEYGNFKMKIIASTDLKQSHLSLIYNRAKQFTWKRGMNIAVLSNSNETTNGDEHEKHN